MAENLFKVEVEIKRIQTFIFDSIELKHIIGANVLLGELTRIKIPECALECMGEKKINLLNLATDNKSKQFELNINDPLYPQTKQTDSYDLTYDDPNKNWKNGIMARDGGHIIVVFCSEDKALCFIKKCRELLIDYPSLDIDIKIKISDDNYNFSPYKSPESNKSGCDVLPSFLFQPGYEDPEFPATNKRKERYYGNQSNKKSDAYERFRSGKSKDVIGVIKSKLSKDRFNYDTLVKFNEKSTFTGIMAADGNDIGNKSTSSADNENGNYFFKELKREQFFYNLRSKVRESVVSVYKANDFKYIIPLMIGGDDLLIAGDPGELFTFVEKFDEKFSSSQNGNQITMGYGIAIAHQKYPFHELHSNAEDTLSSAKAFRRDKYIDSSVMDWNIIKESRMGENIERIKKTTIIPENNTINYRPASRPLPVKTGSFFDFTEFLGKAHQLKTHYSVDITPDNKVKKTVSHGQVKFLASRIQSGYWAAVHAYETLEKTTRIALADLIFNITDENSKLPWLKNEHTGFFTSPACDIFELADFLFETEQNIKNINTDSDDSKSESQQTKDNSNKEYESQHANKDNSSIKHNNSTSLNKTADNRQNNHHGSDSSEKEKTPQTKTELPKVYFRKNTLFEAKSKTEIVSSAFSEMKFTITCLEDIMPGSGMGDKVADNMVSRDSSGNIIITPTSFKGLMREKTEEILWYLNQSKSQDYSTKLSYYLDLFGSTKKKAGTLKITTISADTNSTILRMQSSRDGFSRSPLDDSLRTIELTPAGTTFSGSIFFPDSDETEYFIKLLLSRMTHLGSSKNRGTGKIKIEVKSVTKFKQPKPLSPGSTVSAYTVKYRMYLKNTSPLLIVKYPSATNLMEGLGFINGVSIRGAFLSTAEKIHKEKSTESHMISFGNGYGVSSTDDTAVYPFALNCMYEKGFTPSDNNQVFYKNPQNLKFKRIKKDLTMVFDSSSEKWKWHKIPMVTAMRNNTHTIDLFTTISLEKQLFLSIVEVPAQSANWFESVASSRQPLFMGRGRTPVTIAKIEKIQQGEDALYPPPYPTWVAGNKTYADSIVIDSQSKNNYIQLVLTSHLIAKKPWLTFCTELDAKDIKRVFNIADPFELVDSIQETVRIHGYNASSSLPRMPVLAIIAGSTFLLKFEKEVNPAVITQCKNAGERTVEGYGRYYFQFPATGFDENPITNENGIQPYPEPAIEKIIRTSINKAGELKSLSQFKNLLQNLRYEASIWKTEENINNTFNKFSRHGQIKAGQKSGYTTNNIKHLKEVSKDFTSIEDKKIFYEYFTGYLLRNSKKEKGGNR
ncbi:MAG: hypothetical protein JXR95_04390 [Deltaproteobacteria bacterium]|nr:hypothetical protein [Deltaproteobacteria bacterium]